MVRNVRSAKTQPHWKGIFTVVSFDPAGHIVSTQNGKVQKRIVPLDQLKVAEDAISSLQRVDRIFAKKGVGQLSIPQGRIILREPLSRDEDKVYRQDWYRADQLFPGAIVEYESAALALPGVSDPVDTARKLSSSPSQATVETVSQEE